MEALTLVMADSIRHEANGKLLVVGLYLNVKLRGGPSDNVGEVSVFTTLTEIPEGRHIAKVRISFAGQELEMEPDGIEFNSKGENQIYPMNFVIPDFSFPSSGNYAYQILVDEEVIASNIASIKYDREEDVQEVLADKKHTVDTPPT